MTNPTTKTVVPNSQNNPAPVRFLKSKFRTGMLCLFFLASFSSFKYIPELKILFLIWLGIVLLFLITIYPITVLAQKSRITGLELYSLLILVCVPLIAAYMSNSEFGQPWIYGIGTMGQTVLIGDVMIFLYLYQRRIFHLADVERAFLWLVGLNIIFNILISNIFDANQFDNVNGFVGGMEGEKYFILSKEFIIIGFFYYVFAGYWEKNIRSSFIALLIFIFITLGGGSTRSTLIALVGSYAVLMLRWGWPQKTVGMLLRASAVGVLLVFMLNIFLPGKLIEMQEKFGDAFTVLLKQEEVEDISANVRVEEMTIALTFIEKHWLFGNGVISSSWKGGDESVVEYLERHWLPGTGVIGSSGSGEDVSVLGYFHPSDVGILGVLYMYGFVGTLLFSFQYYFAIRYSYWLPKKGGRHDRLVNAVKGYLLFGAFISIATAKFAVFIEQDLLMMAILYCAVQAERMGNLEVCSGNYRQ